MATTPHSSSNPNPTIHAMSAEERQAHMRRLGALGNANRIVLSADEVEALAGAYRLIDSIYQRHQAKLDRASEGKVRDG